MEPEGVRDRESALKAVATWCESIGLGSILNIELFRYVCVLKGEQIMWVQVTPRGSFNKDNDKPTMRIAEANSAHYEAYARRTDAHLLCDNNVITLDGDPVYASTKREDIAKIGLDGRWHLLGVDEQNKTVPYRVYQGMLAARFGVPEDELLNRIIDPFHTVIIDDVCYAGNGVDKFARITFYMRLDCVPPLRHMNVAMLVRTHVYEHEELADIARDTSLGYFWAVEPHPIKPIMQSVKGGTIMNALVEIRKRNPSERDFQDILWKCVQLSRRRILEHSAQTGASNSSESM